MPNDYQKLISISDAENYLLELSRIENCIIIAAIRDTAGDCFNDKLFEGMQACGFKADLRNKVLRGYIGIIDSGNNIFELLTNPNGQAHYAETVQGIKLEVDSCPWKNGDSARICIDGLSCASNNRGINLVVYDKDTNKVVDTICFDSHVQECTFRRDRPIYYEFIRDTKELMKPYNILPKILYPKIKVRVIFKFRLVGWIVLKSLCVAFANDPKYDLLLVLYPDKDRDGSEYSQAGCKYVYAENYDAAQDQPDITIFLLLWAPWVFTQEELSGFHHNTKMLIGLPLGTLKIISPTDVWVNLLLSGPREADFYILDKLLYSVIEKSGLLKPNIVHIGNPKFDAIYDAMQKKEDLPIEWQKTIGKKVFLLTTDHMKPVFENVTFDLYAKQFFAYFKKHDKDCALIIRLHPEFIRELLRNDTWNKKDYESIKKYCEDSENVIWDERNDYTLAYQMADCIFTDVDCGIILSALTVDKPICVLLRYDEYICEEIFHPEVIAHHNVVNNPEELVDFLDRIRDGEDPKAELRREALTKFISHYDGKNGQRIKDFVEEKFIEKYGTSPI